mmetsp:Transcript_146667/g.365735  ORF Transcript_146667/g.365735 Transcript_146667/m.365735 type:complete len:185 (+) Transcript_146667:20-574(+)
MGSSPSSSCTCASERESRCQRCAPEDGGVCCQTSDDMTLEHQLLSAIVNGEVERALILVRDGPPELVNCRLEVPLSDGTYMCFSDGATPLHLASLLGQYGLVQALLKLKASPVAVDERGHTALAYAERGRHQAIVRLLLEQLELRGAVGQDVAPSPLRQHVAGGGSKTPRSVPTPSRVARSLGS